MDFPFPMKKKTRLIIDTDAKNEVDDQFAIVHALLTPSFDIRGIIAAHFDQPRSMEASYAEIQTILRLMGLAGKVRVEQGAPHSLPDEETPVASPGAECIIEEALNDDPRPLYIVSFGPLTDTASALLMEPQIAEREVRVIWVGGGEWPEGGAEYNLSNDIGAARRVFRSELELWQIPQGRHHHVNVGYAELIQKVWPQGAIGRYLVERLVAWNEEHVEAPIEYHSLSDLRAVGALLLANGGWWSWHSAPEISQSMHYRHHPDQPQGHLIRVYEYPDNRFLLEDFFAKLAIFAQQSDSSIRN